MTNLEELTLRINAGQTYCFERLNEPSTFRFIITSKSIFLDSKRLLTQLVGCVFVFRVVLVTKPLVFTLVEKAANY